MHKSDAILKALFPSPSRIRRISTNSAIHRSLRRSPDRDENASARFGRRPAERSGSRDGRERPLKTNDRPFERRDGTGSSSLRDRTGAPSKYDYSRNPEGNRVTRRAAQFGHAQDLSRPAFRNREPSSAATFHGNSEGEQFDRRVFSPRQERGPQRSRPGLPSRTFDPATSFKTSPEDTYGDRPDFFTRRKDASSRSSESSRFERPRMGRGVRPSTYNTLNERSSRYPDHEEDQPIRQGSRLTRQDPQPRTPSDEQFSSSHDTEEKGYAPMAMPYTTPASEFLYGTSVIVAAFRSKRRKLYKLYMYDGENRDVREQDTMVRRLALDSDVPVERVQRQWLRLMDKMSGGRPHNGYLLEASPLPSLPVKALNRVDKPDGLFNVVLDHQSREDEAVNGTDTRIENKLKAPRFPFVLLLDGILDPGNMGAILRSAYFFGVDSVAISNRQSAPLSAVTLKASAGAAESLPLLSVKKPEEFIEGCKRNGWRIFAADAPSEAASGKSKSSRRSYVSSSTLGNPLQDQPSILILGAEGEGLRWTLHKFADHDVGIEGQRLGQGGVDSLNVSVAAGLLCETFLHRPTARSDTMSQKADKAEEDRLF